MEKKGLFGIVSTIIFVLVLGFVIFWFVNKGNNENITGSVIAGESQQETIVINVEASRWEYTPNIIKLKKGDRVKIIVNDTDTPHGIYIPDLGVRGLGEVEFTANMTGNFSFRCPTMCGQGHRNMVGTLIIEE